MKRQRMNQKQFRTLLDLFTWYREWGLSPREAFIEACEDYVFIYGDGSTPRGILSVSEVTELKEVMPRNK